MIAIERYYRAELLIERLEQIQGEMAAIVLTLPPNDDNEARHLDHAELALKNAVRALRDAKNAASGQCPELLEAQLAASIELIGRSPERMRRLALVPAPKV